MKRFLLAALMVCGVVFCGYAQSEISIDSTNIQHPKGKNRWIIGVEYPFYNLGWSRAYVTASIVYGKQKTKRYFFGYGVAPSYHKYQEISMPIFLCFQFSGKSENPFFFDLRPGINTYIDFDGVPDPGLLIGLGLGKKYKLNNNNYISIAANTRITYMLWSFTVHSGIGVNYHF